VKISLRTALFATALLSFAEAINAQIAGCFWNNSYTCQTAPPAAPSCFTYGTEPTCVAATNIILPTHCFVSVASIGGYPNTTNYQVPCWFTRPCYWDAWEQYCYGGPTVWSGGTFNCTKVVTTSVCELPPEEP